MTGTGSIWYKTVSQGKLFPRYSPMMTSDSRSKADLLADYRELLRIAKERPAGILIQPDSNKLITFLERCIAEIEVETANDDEKIKLTR